MDINKTIEILESLASGCSPKTGEIVENESVLNERDVIRALQIAIYELKRQKPNPIKDSSNQKKNPYKEVDYFRRDKFNTLTFEMIDRLKERINELGISKSENLAEYIIAARENYPRAYEPWSDVEKELFQDSIKFTNDIDILSECFQRGKGSIESFGQKIIYESQKSGEEII